MAVCSSCGHESPDTNKFCGECGAKLEGVRPIAEERKIVTSLFCDLVGFTALSESADPEDVDRMLREYHSLARAQIEFFGGTVQKFIGDAVVGVFGVPAAHEDDPERAVRAGLRILEEVEDLTTSTGEPVRARVGINTGEALVRLDVDPRSGEGFLTGDAVNTASRLQGMAPPMGVVVGEPTWLATKHVFEYEAMDPMTVKGKSEPLAVWLARAPRARLGTDVTRVHATPFVGREADLAILTGLFDEGFASTSVQLVIVVGEPGIGKSRIVAELGRYVDERPELVVWRQGRCLPYGDGVTFWALSEIVKAHAGILETDDPSTAGAKLDAVVPGEGPEREWFRQRLRPLVGLESASTAEREESFTAWRRFVESIAERDPTVLVFEDLHWADEAMLMFVEHVAEWAEGVPLLLVGTARPELFERHSRWSGMRNATTINLAPLSDAETSRLVSVLLDQTLLPANVQATILERSGGNPLYAEEFVRLLKDKGLLVRKGNTFLLAEGADVPRPDSVQALIAARLDTLSSERKAMLQDAAVVGKVFWSGAVVAMGERDPSEVDVALEELSRKELVRPSHRSSMAGEAEFAFWHVLMRDVAYGQIPRGARAIKHRAAAAWVEARAGERLEDLAEVLAHHYTAALELARAAGQAPEADEVLDPALRYLLVAGERALDFDALRAEAHLAKALALAPEDHPRRLELLARWAEAVLRVGRPAAALRPLEQAIASFRDRGDVRPAARALVTLSSVYSAIGDPRPSEAAREAVALLESEPPGQELVAAYAQVAASATVDASEHRDAVVWAERALDLARDLGIPEPARALGFRGLARFQLGDAGGVEDLRRALALATERGEGREVAVLHNNLAVAVWPIEGPAACIDVFRDGIAFCAGKGIAEFALAMTAEALDPLFEVGSFDEVLATAADLTARFEATGSILDLAIVRAVQSRVLALRGLGADALPLAEQAMVVARGSGVPEMIAGTFPVGALARLASGDGEGASALLVELESVPHSRENQSYPAQLPSMVRAAIALGDTSLAARLTGSLERRYPYEEHALVATRAVLAEAAGQMKDALSLYADAADRWERFGVVPERAFALLGQGRCLAAIGPSSEASEPLREARAVFVRLGMTPAVVETDALLSGVIAQA